MPTTVDVALARFAEIAYSETPVGLPGSFGVVGAETLGLASSAGVSFANGVFHEANAAALVVAGLIDRIPTLVLAFRGSDDREDSINSLRNINADYPDFAPLIASVDAYAARAGYRQVVVTGHSLGGAMTQLYMANHPDTASIHYVADTFGSPGALITDGPDPRTVNYRVADDPAVFLGENRASVGAELRSNPFYAGVGVILATEAFPGLTTLDAILSLPSLTRDYENRGQDYVLPRANGTTYLLQDLGDVALASPTEHKVGTYVSRLAALTGGNGDQPNGGLADVRFSGLIAPHVHGDLDGDGRGDLVWQNSSGVPSVWAMQGGVGGASVGAYLNYANPGASWRLVGTADLNGDGRADLLWQNSDGIPSGWLIGQGGGTVTGYPVYNNPGPSWRLVGGADLDGDGRADLLWQNQNGAVSAWTTGQDGASVAAYVDFSSPGASWRLVGGADLDGDGRADLVFQDGSGAVSAWLMGGSLGAPSVSTYSNFANPGPSWTLVGTGDLNGDGRDDLLFQNTSSGLPSAWLMGQDGMSVIGYPTFQNPGADWRLKGAADANGDGRADLVWQNDTGQPSLWIMGAGGTSVDSYPVLSNPGASWHITEG